MENQELSIPTNNSVILDCPQLVAVTNTNQKVYLSVINSDPVITLTPEQTESLAFYFDNAGVQTPIAPIYNKELTYTTVGIQNEKKENTTLQYKVLSVDNVDVSGAVNIPYCKIIEQKQRNVLSNQVSNVQQIQRPIQNLNANCNNQVVYRVLRPEDLQLQMPSKVKPTKRGRPRKHQIEEMDQNEDMLNVIPLKSFRTRSGRITRPPRHIQQESKHYNENIYCQPEANEDTDKKKEVQEETVRKISFPSIEHAKRNISAQFRCGTCNKVYLGRSRMGKHLQLNPSHIAPIVNNTEGKELLWAELMRTVRKAPKRQQALTLCDEFASFLQSARNVIPKLLTPVNDEAPSTYVVNREMSDALGISEGKYAFNETILQNEFQSAKNNSSESNGTENVVTPNVENSVAEQVQNIEIIEQDTIAQNNDQNSLLNLLDTGQVTFDSSATSEEVMNVDQLVNERLKTLTEAELEAPPNNSQNLSLDLSLDMFTYTN